MQAVDRRLTGFAGVMALCLAVSGCVSASLDDSQVDDSQPDDSQLDDSQSATDYVASRGPGGVNPDLNGIWQALNEANYDIERHLARASMGVRDGPHGPVPDLKTLYIGAVASVPPMPDDVRTRVVGAEVPKLLFPFARGIVANAVRDGGFPPFMIDPIDFDALFERAAAARAKEQQGQEVDA